MAEPAVNLGYYHLYINTYVATKKDTTTQQYIRLNVMSNQRSQLAP